MAPKLGMTSEEVLEFQITRDESASGGFMFTILDCAQCAATCMRNMPDVQPLQTSGRIVVIAGVNWDGPAFQGGLRPEHLGWRIIKIDGEPVTATTFDSAFNATRLPGRTFSLTVQKPKTGEITLASTNVEQSSAIPQVYLDPSELDNLSVSIRPHATNGTTFVLHGLSSAAMSAFGLRFTRIIEENLSDIAQLRNTLTEQETAALQQEEEEADKLDVDTEEDGLRCVVCLQKQRAILLLPCRHLVTCHRCTVIVRRAQKCPVCRQLIEDAKGVQEVSLEDVFT